MTQTVPQMNGLGEDVRSIPTCVKLNVQETHAQQQEEPQALALLVETLLNRTWVQLNVKNYVKHRGTVGPQQTPISADTGAM